ncbi:trypco2 family protein [Streptacidiphilus fuscans]|nr:trypco2 family protein [Streptacidiphilus fuscans]
MTNPEDPIDLADAITAIRDQLVDAAGRGAGADIGFEVGPIELEFTVALKRDARAKGGVRAWVFSVDGEVGEAYDRTHRVAVTLTPKSRTTGGSLEVGNHTAPDLSGF